MAEGGIAASMGNVNSNDNWQVHFRDTMRGGKFLNNWRMAELHAKEAPERVWELETYGALFDRTPDGKISQRNFGGHEYPRLAHVGDRTGLELIRTLQQKIVSLQQDDAQATGQTGAYDGKLKVFAECTDHRAAAATTTARSPARSATGARPGEFVLFQAPAVVLATGGIGKSFKVTSNSWEYTGDGHALALRAGSTLLNMEFVQFHPTGMVWPPSVKGILVTESVRGDGGVLRNSEGKRFMFDYVPDVFREQYAETEEEADRWYTDPDNNRRPPELLPRDEVARAINSEVKAGRGSPHGGVFLDIATPAPPEEILKRLPSMHHQFKELADVDITAEPMEVGPTCHYVMGGVEVDPDTAAAADVPGLFAAGEVGRRHARLEPARRQLAVRPAGLRPAGRRRRRRVRRGAGRHVPGGRPRPQLDAAAASRARAVRRGRRRGENPYTLHQELQQTMNDLVGIIRKAEEIEQALERARRRSRRGRAKVGVEGHRQFNPGWHLALDLRNMLVVSECVARAALHPRGAPRRAHPRRLPGDESRVAPGEPDLLGRTATATASRSSSSRCRRCATDLLALFERDELRKYLTDAELAAARPEEEQSMSYDAQVPGVARRRRRRRPRRLHRRGERGRGRARHHPPAAGHPGRRPGRPLELQGRQVRLVQRRDQRPAAAAVHDPDVDLHRGRDDHRHPDAGLPGDPGPGHRRVVQLQEGPRGAGLRAAGRTWRPASTGWSRWTSSARRSSASASSASCARTPATWCATTRRTRRPSPGRAS